MSSTLPWDAVSDALVGFVRDAVEDRSVVEMELRRSQEKLSASLDGIRVDLEAVMAGMQGVGDVGQAVEKEVSETKEIIERTMRKMRTISARVSSMKGELGRGRRRRAAAVEVEMRVVSPGEGQG